jgi:hypothetical protein
MVDDVQTYQGEGVNEAGDPAHVHEMLAKVEEPIQTFDNEEETYTRDESRPEWLPEKFNSAEELAQAYKNLEQQFHSGSEEREQQEEQQRFQDEEVPAIQETSPSQVHQLLDDKGLDFSAFQEEYNNTGTLSKEALEALSEAGINEDVASTWISGQEALRDQNIETVHSNVGGEQNYNNMLEWANDSLQSWEVEAFNKQLENLDANTQFAVAGLYARYQNSEGIPPALMSGEVGQDVAPRYESLAQVTSAMSDPKYASDPAYRARVAQRLGNSNVL